MNWTQIQQLLISLVLPALVSIIVVLFNNARQKKLEFEYDYRKYLLDKRKKAYDEVEKILNTLNDAYGLDEHWLWRLEKEEIYHIVSFNDSISDVLANGIWLSDERSNSFNSRTSKQHDR